MLLKKEKKNQGIIQRRYETENKHMSISNVLTQIKKDKWAPVAHLLTIV